MGFPSHPIGNFRGLYICCSSSSLSVSSCVSSYQDYLIQRTIKWAHFSNIEGIEVNGQHLNGIWKKSKTSFSRKQGLWNLKNKSFYLSNIFNDLRRDKSCFVHPTVNSFEISPLNKKFGSNGFSKWHTRISPVNNFFSYVNFCQVTLFSLTLS